jgi:hypothetical protein
MARPRKREYRTPIAAVPHSSIERKLIGASPAFTMGIEDSRALALAPPGLEYPMSYEPRAGDDPDAYRNWLIKVLGVLTDCYPAPINMALDCLRKSLIEVNRGLTPNLFKPVKRARGGKRNFAAQEAMNLAVLAASYIHDVAGNDESYEKSLEVAGTTRIEIDQWRTSRIDPAYQCSAIVAWTDLAGAEFTLQYAVEDAKAATARKPRRKAKVERNPAS